MSVGVSEIDKQHQQLVALINDLNEAMKARQGRSALEATITGLMDYAARHFALEEKLFDEYRYPAALAHEGEKE